MYATDRDALVCDMAETYHVYDVRQLPVPLFATLAAGLRSNSRIRMKMAGYEYIPPELGIFAIHDILMKVFSDKKAKPDMLVDTWLGEGKKKAEGRSFTTTEELDDFRQRIFNRGTGKQEA